MVTYSETGAVRLGSVTVTFNPDVEVLERQLRALPAQCPKILVDNASAFESRERIHMLAARVANVMVIRNEANVGLAAALNVGVSNLSGMTSPPRFALLLDQDSEPQAGSVEALLAAFDELEAAGHDVGCVGPLLLDPDAGVTHGFHVSRGWRWGRVFPLSGAPCNVRCTNLNGSGTLVPVDLFVGLGGLDASLFIDHVDTEWSFRVLDTGFSLWGVPKAVFVHRMGVAGIRFWWFGWRVWPSRVPVRHYYLFRNAVRLMRRSYVPTVWKTWAVLKLILTAVIHGIAGPDRVSQLRHMIRGVADGVLHDGVSARVRGGINVS